MKLGRCPSSQKEGDTHDFNWLTSGFEPETLGPKSHALITPKFSFGFSREIAGDCVEK